MEKTTKEEKRIQEITHYMGSKPTPELLEIWVENNHITHLEETFPAIQRILIERDVALPPQNPPKHKPKGLETLTDDAMSWELRNWSIVFALWGLFFIFRDEPWTISLSYLAGSAIVFIFRHRILYLIAGSWMLVNGVLLILQYQVYGFGLFAITTQLIIAFYLLFKFYWYGLPAHRKTELILKFKR